MAEVEQDSQGSKDSSPEKQLEPWRTCANCGLNIYKDNPNYSQKWAGHSRNCPSLESVQRSKVIETKLRCSICRSSFATPEQLDAHVQTHTVEKRVRKPVNFESMSNGQPKRQLEDDSPRAKRRKRANKGKPVVKTDACQLISVGELVPLSDPNYVNYYAVKQRMGNQLFYLFPPGFESRRIFKDRTYSCRIESNGDYPQFLVQELDDGHPVGAPSAAPNPSQAVRECVGVNVSGPQFFGLTLPWIHGKIQGLAGAKQLSSTIRSKIEQSHPAQGIVLEDNEEDLDDDEPATQSCPYCPATYSSGIGLRYHIDRKHPNGESRKPFLHTDEEHCGVCLNRDYSFWTSCDQCQGWFHQACVGISPPEREVRSFFCPKCKPRPSSVTNAVAELQRKVSQVEDDNKHLSTENDYVEGELYRCLRDLKDERLYSKDLEKRLEETAERLKVLQGELLVYKKTLGSLTEIPKSKADLHKIAILNA